MPTLFDEVNQERAAGDSAPRYSDAVTDTVEGSLSTGKVSTNDDVNVSHNSASGGQPPSMGTDPGMRADVDSVSSKTGGGAMPTVSELTVEHSTPSTQPAATPATQPGTSSSAMSAGMRACTASFADKTDVQVTDDRYTKMLARFLSDSVVAPKEKESRLYS